MLVDGLRLLAAPAREQIAALPDYVIVTHEVISAFSNAYLLVPQLQGSGHLDAPAVLALEKVDAHIEAAPPDDDLEENESLETHPFWAEARRLAADALRQLGQPVGPLELRSVSFVKR